MAYNSPSLIQFPRRLVIDDTDPRVKYETQSQWSLDASGTFNNISSLGSVYNNTMHGSRQDGSSFSFTFEGEYASVWGAKDNRKIARNGSNDNLTMLAHWQCQVDGLPMLHIDYTIPMDWITNNLLCETSGLSATSPHVLTVNITIQDPQTQMFWFDKIEYAPGPNVKLAGEVMKFDSSDESIQYNNDSGSWITDAGQTPLTNETRQAGASMSFRFNGTQVTLYAYYEGDVSLRAVSNGSYRIDDLNDQTFVIPGSRPSPSNSSALSDHWNEWLFTSPELDPGAHQLMITYTGISMGDTPLQALMVDYFYVTASEEPVNGTGDSGNSGGSGSSGATSASPKDKPVGAIVGGVIGGLVALTLVGLVVLLFLRRRRQQHEEYSDDLQPEPYQRFAKSTSEAGPVSNPRPAPDLQSMKDAQRAAVAGQVVQRRHQDSGIRYTDIPPDYTEQ